MCIFRVVAIKKDEQIILDALIILTFCELLDDIFNVNSYMPHNPLSTNKKLLLDSIIIGTITLLTVKKLIKQWKTKNKP